MTIEHTNPYSSPLVEHERSNSLGLFKLTGWVFSATLGVSLSILTLFGNAPSSFRICLNSLWYESHILAITASFAIALNSALAISSSVLLKRYYIRFLLLVVLSSLTILFLYLADFYFPLGGVVWDPSDILAMYGGIVLLPALGVLVVAQTGRRPLFLFALFLVLAAEASLVVLRSI